jgi:hypothetical protein
VSWITGVTKTVNSWSYPHFILKVCEQVIINVDSLTCTLFPVSDEILCTNMTLDITNAIPGEYARNVLLYAIC